MVDLSISLGKIRLANPLVLASGIRGNNADLLIRAAREGAGAVTSKSCSLLPREGHANPTAIMQGELMLNAIGLSNPGVKEEIPEIKKAVKEAGVPVIASVYANSADDFALVAEKICAAQPALIELDISCPNVHNEGEMFSSTCESAAAVTSAVKSKLRASSISIPVFVKLAPNVPDIGSIASACQQCGADGISAINTVPGLWIDVRAKRAVLHNAYGGLSGPAILPVALRCVSDIRKACPTLPIIGGGGVTYGEDAARMLMAGATAVSVGSAVCYRKNAFEQIKAELAKYMQEEGLDKISQIKLAD
ncbi:MAG: dihydroorotate dehydrogenase [Candidatus Micrarchaeota archaeon]